MAILESYTDGRCSRTMYLSIPEKTTRDDIERFLEYISSKSDCRIIYRNRKTPLSPVVKKEILEADEYGIALTSAIAERNNRTLKEDIPFLMENDRKPIFWFLNPEDIRYKTYMNKALFTSSHMTEEEKDKVYDFLDKAKELQDGRKYKEAFTIMEKAMKILHGTGPESDLEQIHLTMRGYLTAASILYDSGNRTDAREEFRDASICMSRLITEENYPDVSQFLGEAYANLLDFLIEDGNYEEALEKANEAILALKLVEHELFAQEAHIMACQAMALHGLGMDSEAKEILDELDEEINSLPRFMRAMCMNSYITARQVISEGIRIKPAKEDRKEELEEIYNEGNDLFFNEEWTTAITAFTKAEDLIGEMHSRNMQIIDMNVDIHVKKAYAYCHAGSRKETAEALGIAYGNLKDYKSAVPGYQDVDRILLCVHAALVYANKADLKKWITLLDHAFTNLLKDTYLNDIPEDDRIWTTLEDARNILNNYLYY